MYINQEDYSALYPNDEIAERFGRLSWDASKLMDDLTTGVDGIKKLKYAAPVGDDAEAVRRCAAALVHLMCRIETMEEERENAAKIVKQTDGTYQSALVASRSAGNESISYATGGSGTSTLLDQAVSDMSAREQMYRDTITSYLSGITDANGVNLLYMGRYPCGLEM